MKTLIIFLGLLMVSNTLADRTCSADNCGYDDSVLYLDVDELPKFQSLNYSTALEYIYSHIQYPQEIDVQGKVVVSFIVTKDGEIEKINIENKLCSECDSEVMRVLRNMPKWNAGKVNGEAVDTLLFLAIDFKLT